MKPEQLQRIDEVFQFAVDLPAERRPGFLDAACGEDADLRVEVESLLAAHQQAGAFIEDSASDLAAALLETDSLQPKQVGQYKIEKLIGVGGMGEVFVAEDSKLLRRIALKLLPAEFCQDRKRAARFLREARAASALNHPNICTIYEINDDNDVPFIAMEYVEGETLAEKIKIKRFDVAAALDVALQIADALAEAHEHGIIHRDIKPANIIVNRRGQVKILDFGLAKKIASESGADTQQFLSQAGMILGTAAYMSPEQSRGDPVDARTDVWSFGVVLYEMLAGEKPFTGATTADLLAAILRSEPEGLRKLNSDVPPELERIILKSLRKDCDERYNSAQDFLSDLKQLKRDLDFADAKSRSQPSSGVAEARTRIVDPATSQSGRKPPARVASNTGQLLHNLSKQSIAIIGREKEIATISELLHRDDVQLVTMTGVGGTGKTVLAQAVARKVLPSFRDGVFFVELGALTDPKLVAATIAQLLGVKEAGGRSIVELLKDHLREQEMLLLLDNFEQVIDAAVLIKELIAAAEGLKILVTSRVLLHLQTEHEIVIPPLAVPSDSSTTSVDELSHYDAVRLFVERAQSAKPNFALTSHNANGVAEICASLDGLPLAIELAAARVRFLTPQAILTKLEHRLHFLTGGAHDLPKRQQTMRGAVAWSYDLLTENEKRLFRRLAVFAGGFTFEAAESVVSSQLSFVSGETIPDPRAIDVLNLITSLVDQSLLISKERADGHVRFRMLEVVREYAIESLEAGNEAEAMRRSHAAYFLALAEEAEPHLQDAQSAEWLKRLDEEYDNLRAALRWSLEADHETASRLAGSIRNFWTVQNYFSEGRWWLEAALESSGDGPSAARFKLLHGLGWLARSQGDYETAREIYERGLAASRAAGDKRELAPLSRSLGVVAHQQGDFEAARKFMEEGLAISRELKDQLGTAYALNSLGDLARSEGKTKEAGLLLEESLAIVRRFGNKHAVSNNLNNLGAVAYLEGDYDAACTHFAEALMTAEELGYKSSISYSLDGFAALTAARGASARAAQLAGAAESLRESIGFEIEPADRRFRDGFQAELRGALNKAEFATAFEQGRRLKLEEAEALALEEYNRQQQTKNIGPVTDSNQESDEVSITPRSLLSKDKAFAGGTPSLRRGYTITISVLVLAAFGVGIWFYGYRNSTTTQIQSIAVLPFVNESGSSDVEYLSDGMTETLINSLSQLPHLSVKSSSSVFRYKGKYLEPQQVASELSVQAVLNGRVVQRGDDLTLYLSLVDARNGNQLWGEQYNRKLAELVPLQGEIARDVSRKLGARLSGADERKVAKNYTENVEAYQFYLKGRYHLAKLILPEAQKGISYFQQAIDVDPYYALAYVGLADGYRALALSSGEMPASEYMPRAKAAAQKAIEIDDTLAEAHASLGFIMFWYDWDWNEAEKQCNRALELNPNSPDALQNHAHLLSNTGRHAEALAEIKRARELDPLSLRTNAIEGEFLIHAGQPDEALARLQKTLELDPNYWFAHMFAASAYIQKGMFAEAVVEARKAREDSGVSSTFPLSLDAYALAKWGKITEARVVLKELLKLSAARYVPPYHIALIYNGLGQRDEALAWLQRGYKQRDPKMVFLKVEPKWNNLHSDPRFQDLMRRVGFTP